MKTRIFALLCFSFFLMPMMAHQAMSSDNHSGNLKDISMEISNASLVEEEIISWLTEQNRETEEKGQVLILNGEAQIIKIGEEEDEHIRQLVNESDLLTEVNNTKYYRLSYR